MNIDVELEAPRPRPLSGGIWTLFSWMRRTEKSLSNDSISSVGSDRTAASFDFLSPVEYKYSQEPLVISPVPQTDTYKKRLHDNNLRRKRERDITLHRKYGLWREEGIGYDALTLPPLLKNNTEPGDKKGRCRRAASECLQRRAAYVPGKRRAPLPPVSYTSKSLPRNYKRKRPAPKPPVKEYPENNKNIEINNNEVQVNGSSIQRIKKESENISESSLIESKEDIQSKDIKLRVEKSFLRQLFDSKKRNSAIEFRQVKLLPSISELDKEAAEIIENNKNLRNYNSVNLHEMTGEMWMCTKCLRKYNMTIKACVYCVAKDRRLNNLVKDSKNSSSSSTQTDTSRRAVETITKPKIGIDSEEKKKLKEMLKEMKDSLPKRNFKFDSNNCPKEKFVSTETPTLRVGCSARENVIPLQSLFGLNIERNTDTNNSKIISDQEANKSKNSDTNNTLLINKPIDSLNIRDNVPSQTAVTGTSNCNVNVKIPAVNVKNLESYKPVIKVVNVGKETIDVEKTSFGKPSTIIDFKKTGGQTSVKFNWLNDPGTSSNINLNTPLKISSLLNPIYLPRTNILTGNLCSDVKHSMPLLEEKNTNKSTGSSSVLQDSTVENKNEQCKPKIIEKEKKDNCVLNSQKSNLCKHAVRRDLINQLEYSIAKGDEKVAAEAASKLAKLRVACSVLSFSSQIVARPSTSKDFLNNETTAKPDFKHKTNLCESHAKQTVKKKEEQDENSNKIEVKSTKDILSSQVTPSKSTSGSNPSPNRNIVSIAVWIEDKVATRGPINLNISRNDTLAELRKVAETNLGLQRRLQRWIVGKTLCIDDTLKINTVAGQDFTAPFYLCVVDSEQTSTNIIENIVKTNNDKESTSTNPSGDFYNELIKLEQQALVSNTDNFECGVCMEECTTGNGAVLRDCIHTFCRECLTDVVRHSEEPIVSCPAIGCPGVLQDREIRAILSQEDYDKWLARGLAAVESGTRNTFHCRTPDCKGWAFCEPGVRKFPCPVCKHTNCLPCQAVHEGNTCEQHQKQLQETLTAAVGNNQTDEGTQALLNSLISRGEALECPECKSIITKKWGCDWVKCSACKTEICWITKGRRWGPGGRGDTSAGCRCGVDGKRCHPSCGYCH